MSSVRWALDLRRSHLLNLSLITTELRTWTRVSVDSYVSSTSKPRCKRYEMERIVSSLDLFLNTNWQSPDIYINTCNAQLTNKYCIYMKTLHSTSTQLTQYWPVTLSRFIQQVDITKTDTIYTLGHSYSTPKYVLPSSFVKSNVQCKFLAIEACTRNQHRFFEGFHVGV